ncbi:TonB-linked outer membrane protein, SusC/RagA family [Fodinibius roseus]|uniref:TonB-linked outer membrane protein, SusC/RagA family n=2 Tax=Fodinibius roseus TaxID=1194090 RepID=A0A1M4V6A0_9BACT|nr:TonB-linked outer membrane protein, SusC/RagA family [Fodinibius roseus]
MSVNINRGSLIMINRDRYIDLYERIAKLVSMVVLFGVLALPLMGQDSQQANEQVASVGTLEQLLNTEVRQDIDESSVLNKSITLRVEQTTLLDALKSIASKGHLKLSYDTQLPVLGNHLSLDLEEISIQDALWKVLENTGLRFAVSPSGQLILMNKNEKLTIQRVQETITGTVTDARTGETLPGVNILLKGTSTGASTDGEGYYEVTVPSLQDTLVFTYIGYQRQEVAISGRTEIDITLQPQAISGEELVVVGYGTQERQDVTGSVSTISSEGLESRPATNMTSLLQGKSPGVTITQSSGQPGQEDHSILIRGVGTMNNSSPMVLIDGVEASMDDVNPNDVESVSVLKDAASAAIYGSRAANGVVLITTKRGNRESMNVSYKTHIGWQQATRLPEYVSSAEYGRLLNEANINEGLDPRYTQEEITKFETGSDPYNYPNTQWLDLLLQGSGFTQNHDLSFAGGSDVNRYRVSLGYNEQYGLMEKANSDRYNLRINFDSDVTDWFDLGVNASLTRRETTNPANPFNSGGSVYQFFRQANRIPPIVANKYEDGAWDRHDDGNPIAWIEEGGKYQEKNSRVVGSLTGEAHLMEGLSLQGTASANYELSDGKDHDRTIAYGDGSVQGPNSVEDQVYRSSVTVLEAMLEYDRRHGDHGINGLLGVYRKRELGNSLSAYRQEFPSNDISELTAGSQEGWSNDGSAVESKLGSYFGRINYDFRSRYLVQANLRYDGSSKFAREQRWGWFPSFSAGWRIAEESFMDDISWINELKLRGSWGKLGNNRIGNYQYIPLISLGQNYNFGGSASSGAAQTSPTNPDITWETTTEMDIGFDAGLFENQLSLTFDYYNRYTDDILTSVPVSDIYGLPAPTVNAGAMRNRGIEFEVAHNNNIRDFQYDVSLYGAYNINKVERYENPDIGTSIRKEGIAWNSYYGYEAIGVFQNEADVDASPHIPGNTPAVGDQKYQDQNGDGVINGDDRIVLGNTIPEITFGFNLGLNYKGFDLSTFFQGADRVYRTIHPEAMWPFQNGAKVQQMHMDRTIVENNEVVREGRYPRVVTTALTGHTTSYYQFSSFSVLDAAYIRLKNIQLGYTVPVTWSGDYLSNVRVFFSGENLLTITGFPGNYDPETPNGVGYPQVKTYTLGLNITF